MFHLAFLLLFSQAKDVPVKSVSSDFMMSKWLYTQFYEGNPYETQGFKGIERTKRKQKRPYIARAKEIGQNENSLCKSISIIYRKRWRQNKSETKNIYVIALAKTEKLFFCISILLGLYTKRNLRAAVVAGRIRKWIWKHHPYKHKY